MVELAKQDGIAVPAAPDDEHKAMRARLESASEAEFDRAYMDGQVTDHQKTAQLLEHEIGSGQDAELKSFASETLPVVLGHLRMARDVQEGMAGKSP